MGGKGTHKNGFIDHYSPGNRIFGDLPLYILVSSFVLKLISGKRLANRKFRSFLYNGKLNAESIVTHLKNVDV